MNSDNPIRKALDAAAIATLAFVCASGVVVHVSRVPLGPSMTLTGGSLYPVFLGLTQTEWTSISNQASLLFLLLLLPNLFWGRGALKWIIRRGERQGSFSRAALGVISATTLVALAASDLRPAGARRGEMPEGVVPLLGEESDARLVKLSLEQLELRTGAPAEFVRGNLGLPPNVSKTEPLANLMAEYRIPVETLRSVLLMHGAGKIFPPPGASPAAGHNH